MKPSSLDGEGRDIREELVNILPELRLYARSLTFSVADAEDLVSETCIRVLERQSQFDPNQRLIAWSIRICKNIYIDKLKSMSSNENPIEDVGNEADPLSCKSIEDRLELNEVHRLLHRLPLPQREVLVLKGGGFSYKEIEERLGIPRGTVMSRLHRGRQALEELMKTKVAI